MTQPNLCDTITSFNIFIARVTSFSSMRWSSFSNNWWGRHNSLCWQCILYYKHLWNLWNGNTWPLYAHMGLVIMHGRPTVTLVGLEAHDILLSSFRPSGKRLWNLYLRNSSIGFDNSHCINSHCIGIKFTWPQGWSWSQNMIPIPASPKLRFSDHWVGSRGESKSFKIIFRYTSVR